MMESVSDNSITAKFLYMMYVMTTRREWEWLMGETELLCEEEACGLLASEVKM